MGDSKQWRNRVRERNKPRHKNKTKENLPDSNSNNSSNITLISKITTCSLCGKDNSISTCCDKQRPLAYHNNLLICHECELKGCCLSCGVWCNNFVCESVKCRVDIMGHPPDPPYLGTLKSRCKLKQHLTEFK
jgi:hypothetical protein